MEKQTEEELFPMRTIQIVFSFYTMCFAKPRCNESNSLEYSQSLITVDMNTTSIKLTFMKFYLFYCFIQFGCVLSSTMYFP